ncbi:MAG: hypothetical protein ABI969_04625 [bacterium]
MIYYSIPLSRYPETYSGNPLCYVGLPAQKNYNATYLMGVYGDDGNAKQFKDARKGGKKARACASSPPTILRSTRLPTPSRQCQ